MKETTSRCWYCGQFLVEYNEIRHLENAQNFPHLRTTDHMKPRSRGGADRWKKGRMNKVDCCQACNGTKANRTVEEFRRLLMHRHNLAQVYFFGEGAEYENTRIFSS